MVMTNKILGIGTSKLHEWTAKRWGLESVLRKHGSRADGNSRQLWHYLSVEQLNLSIRDFTTVSIGSGMLMATISRFTCTQDRSIASLDFHWSGKPHLKEVMAETQRKTDETNSTLWSHMWGTADCNRCQSCSYSIFYSLCHVCKKSRKMDLRSSRELNAGKLYRDSPVSSQSEV